MSRFASRFGSGSRRYESMNHANEPIIAPRSLFSVPDESLDMTDVGSFEDMDASSSYSRQSTVSEPMWHAMRNGAQISDLIKAAPADVIRVLKHHAVKKLGSFKVKDSDALIAFDRNIMLTRGSDTARDGNYRRNWEEIIRVNVDRRTKRHTTLLKDNPWEEDVTVTAYVVNMKDAAAGHEKGLLSPLVKKSQIGTTSNAIFDIPAVRAVIEYKWRNWARRYLLFEFGLYLGWLLSYLAYMITYIEEDIFNDFDEQGQGGKFLKMEAFGADVLSIIFMLPFLAIEYNTIRAYGMRWLQMWNVIDSIAYVLQFAVTYCHLVAEEHINNSHYATLLAVQCVLLFVKVQYFGRVFGAQTSFMELLARVISKARWFFVFIIMTMISVALSFAVLYKEDAGIEKYESAGDFENTVRSIVTTYAVLLGDFDSAYVFEGSNRFVKGFFFLFFQVIMSITVLNLLIAVMTESYGAVTKGSRIMYNIGRAQIMDELEVALPKSWGPNLKPFCHFLMVERDSKDTALIPELVTDSSARTDPGLQREVKNLSDKIESLTSQVDKLAKKMSGGVDDST